MFAILYGLFSLFCKAGWNIEYGIDKFNAERKAIEEGRDTYYDKRGVQRLLGSDEAVVLCRNMSGETYYTDTKGNVVKWINKNDKYNYSVVTAEWCLDNRREHITCNSLPPKINKDIKAKGSLLRDIETGQYMVLRKFYLDKGEMVDGRTFDANKVDRKIRNLHRRTCSFYMNANTLELIRESDGSAELRRRGYKGCISENCRDNFINKYNQKLKESYKVEDFARGQCEDFDISSEGIEKLMWEQNRKEIKTNE